MNGYTIALFVHVLSAIGFYTSVITGLFGATAMRRAQRVEQVRAILGLLALTDPLSAISGLLILITGLYMAKTAWGFTTGWIDVGLISVFLLIPFGAGIVAPRRRVLARLAQAAPEGPLTADLAARIFDPALRAGLFAQAGLLLGIVFLMTMKPDLVPAIISMAVALALGLAAAVLSQGGRAARPSVTTP
jgi:uncharacterized membrane protein YiaA